MAPSRWIGVDFDHTLCRSDYTPVARMVARVKKWLALGLEVRIVTARVNHIDHTPEQIAEAVLFIEKWCRMFIGETLQIQSCKSSGMVSLWDDKVVSVQHDVGARDHVPSTHYNASHGYYGTRTYLKWNEMMRRAGRPSSFDPESKYFARYAGRGILVCERWKSFENFLEDMGECPDKLELDRTDNDKGYEPGNCQWVTHNEQMKNRRNRR